MDPKMAAAHYHIGCAYYYKGDLDKAMAHFEKALSLDPLDEQSARNLRTLKDLRGRFF